MIHCYVAGKGQHPTRLSITYLKIVPERYHKFFLCCAAKYGDGEMSSNEIPTGFTKCIQDNLLELTLLWLTGIAEVVVSMCCLIVAACQEYLFVLSSLMCDMFVYYHYS